MTILPNLISTSSSSISVSQPRLPASTPSTSAPPTQLPSFSAFAPSGDHADQSTSRETHETRPFFPLDSWSDLRLDTSSGSSSQPPYERPRAPIPGKHRHRRVDSLPSTFMSSSSEYEGEAICFNASDSYSGWQTSAEQGEPNADIESQESNDSRPQRQDQEERRLPNLSDSSPLSSFIIKGCRPTDSPKGILGAHRRKPSTKRRDVSQPDHFDTKTKPAVAGDYFAPLPGAHVSPVPPPRSSSRPRLRRDCSKSIQIHGSEQQRCRRPLTPYPGFDCGEAPPAAEEARRREMGKVAAYITAGRQAEKSKIDGDLGVEATTNGHWPWNSVPLQRFSSAAEPKAATSQLHLANLSGDDTAVASQSQHSDLQRKQLWSYPNPFAVPSAYATNAGAQFRRVSPMQSETTTLTGSLLPAQQAAAACKHSCDEDPPRPDTCSPTGKRLRDYYQRLFRSISTQGTAPTRPPTRLAMPRDGSHATLHSKYSGEETIRAGTTAHDGSMAYRGGGWFSAYHGVPNKMSISPDVTSGSHSYEREMRHRGEAGKPPGTSKKAGTDGRPPVHREQRRRLSASVWPKSLQHSTASSTSLSDESDWDSQGAAGGAGYVLDRGRDSPPSAFGHPPPAYPPGPAGHAADATTGIPSYHLLLHQLVAQWDEALLYLESNHLHSFDSSQQTPKVISRFLVFRLPPITLFILLASFFIYICFKYEVPPSLYGLMGSITVGLMAWATFACQRGEENMDKERESEVQLLKQKWLKGKVRERRRRRRRERKRMKEAEAVAKRAALIAEAMAVAASERNQVLGGLNRVTSSSRGGKQHQQQRSPRPAPHATRSNRPQSSQSAPAAPVEVVRKASTTLRGILTSPAATVPPKATATSALPSPSVGFALPSASDRIKRSCWGSRMAEAARSPVVEIGGASPLQQQDATMARRRSEAARVSRNPFADIRQEDQRDSHLGEEQAKTTPKSQQDANSTTTSTAGYDSQDAEHAAEEEQHESSITYSERRAWIKRWAREASFAPLCAPPADPSNEPLASSSLFTTGPYIDWAEGGVLHQQAPTDGQRRAMQPSTSMATTLAYTNALTPALGSPAIERDEPREPCPSPVAVRDRNRAPEPATEPPPPPSHTTPETVTTAQGTMEGTNGTNGTSSNAQEASRASGQGAEWIRNAVNEARALLQHNRLGLQNGENSSTGGVTSVPREGSTPHTLPSSPSGRRPLPSLPSLTRDRLFSSPKSNRSNASNPLAPGPPSTTASPAGAVKRRSRAPSRSTAVGGMAATAAAAAVAHSVTLPGGRGGGGGWAAGL
ncbi:hypothetical protein BDZ90DRAFT_263126 [Jaminaea rosea]|uniref:Uncharacterized protein n=1 Tax=Jaminaea rosea TaxID=1569628 RepID=A0A316UH49_9BASI|nr:hypothetical protein BDZ90DRAFT_263126 [Jaminaea rosea]PWN24579.1 hypothetical protein BDZ90DRAFT_263126 [Jaminaea rosea]